MAANNIIPSIPLVAAGPRTVVLDDEALAYNDSFLAALRDANNTNVAIATCHMLDISCRAWRENVLQLLEPSLIIIAETVVDLRVDDIIASLVTDEGLATLLYVATLFANAPQLQSVNLNDNAIGTRGIASLQGLLLNVNVTDWFLANTGLAEADALTLLQTFAPNAAVTVAATNTIAAHGTVEAAADAAVAAIGTETNNDATRQTFSRLTTLHTARNRMGHNGAKLLGALLSVSIHLVSFSHAGSSPLRSGTVGLCKGLRAMAEACVNQNTGDESTTSTSGKASNTTVLEHLDVSDVCLKDSQRDGHDCVDDLRFVLVHSPRLFVLKLKDSGLTVDELDVVLQALSTSGAPLTTLDLEGLEMGDEGVALLTTALTNATTTWTLQHLALGLNELGDDGVTAVILALQAASATPVAANLLSLDVSDNDIGADGAQALIDHHLASLHTLNLKDNTEIPLSRARALARLYTTVVVDDDLEDDGEGDDEDDNEDNDDDADADADDAADDVDALVAGMGAARLE